jgi:hypothetical protein
MNSTQELFSEMEDTDQWTGIFVLGVLAKEPNSDFSLSVNLYEF